MQIRKFELPARDGDHQLLISAPARILSVQEQNNRPQLWALVDPASSELVSVVVRLFETGQEFSPHEGGQFLGTVLLDDGAYVLHVFYKYG